MNNKSNSKILILDTTMRDGELTPGIKLNLGQKIQLAKLLENIGLDLIEIGYPGVYKKDFQEIFTISKYIKKSIICGLASSKKQEIIQLKLAIKPAIRKRIHLFTMINLKGKLNVNKQEILNLIEDSIKLAKNYTDDVQWLPFNAVKSDPDFLCQTIETAINHGAKTINIPDTLGNYSTEEFGDLISLIINRVPNIEKAVISVHCHNDLGLAVDNSLAAITKGARQIECAINGLGARKGNADLEKVVSKIKSLDGYNTHIKLDLISEASKLEFLHI